MDKPSINVDGKIIEMPKPTAAVWRKAMEFHTTRNEVKLIDFIDDYISILAVMFGLTKEDLIDKIEIEDIYPTYDASIAYLMNLVFAKMGNNKKNEDAVTE